MQERKLASRMAELSSLALKCNQAANRAVVRTQYSDRAEDNQTREWDASLKRLDQAVGELLTELQGILDSLAQATAVDNAQQQAFLSRCRTVLQDTVQEKARIYEMGQKALWRLSLYEDDEPYSSVEDGGLTSTRSQAQALLNEHAKLEESLATIEEVTRIGDASHKTMLRTTENFRLIRRGIDKVGAAFPVINNLINHIRRHRHRDAIVIAAVIALCMAFTVIYISRKS